MSYAVRKDGRGWRAVNSPADVGPDEVFSDTQPGVITESVPAVVTRAQFKLALLDLGLLDDVEALVAGSSDRALQINWAERLEFERNHPLVIATATALGKTDVEIDALFVLAASL